MFGGRESCFSSPGSFFVRSQQQDFRMQTSQMKGFRLVSAAEEQNTDKASVMIIAVSLPVASPCMGEAGCVCLRQRKGGDKGRALLVIFSRDSQVVTLRKTTQLPVIKRTVI